MVPLRRTPAPLLMGAALLLLGACQGDPGAGSEGSEGGGQLPRGDGRVTVRNAPRRGTPRRPWLAWNDGDGPWQVVEGPGPIHVLRPMSGRYGVAIVCEQEGDRPTVQVTQAGVAELPELVTECADPLPPGERRLTGDILSLADPRAQVSVHLASDGGPTTVRRETWQRYEATVPDGKLDLVAAARELGGTLLAAIVRRDVVISGDGTLDLDFAVDPVAPVRHPISVEGAGTSTPLVSVWFQTARGAELDLTTATPGEYRTVAGLAPGDRHLLNVVVQDETDSEQTRAVVRTFREGKPMMATLPPPLTSVAASATAIDGRLVPRVTFDVYPGAVSYGVLAMVHEVGAYPGAFLQATFTPRWLGSARSYTAPDLAGLPGFKASWALSAASTSRGLTFTAAVAQGRTTAEVFQDRDADVDLGIVHKDMGLGR